MALFELTFFWTVVKDVTERLTEHNKKTSEALGAVRKAFNHTFDYVVNNQGQYKPNMDLADLWNEASTKVMLVDKGLGDMLANKSRFWTHPDIYNELNRAENILTLKEITDEMERLRIAMK